MLFISSHLSPLTSAVMGATQMTLQKYLSTFPCFRLPSGNLQIPLLSISWCYLPISSSVFLSFLLFSMTLQNCLRHDVAIPFEFPFLYHGSRLGGHHTLQLHSGDCCEPPRSSHGLCSEVFYSISSQRLGSVLRVLLSKSSSQRHKGRWITWASA